MCSYISQRIILYHSVWFILNLFYNYVLLHTTSNINLPIKQQKTLYYWISPIWRTFFISYCNQITPPPNCFHLRPSLSPISISRPSHSHLRSTYRGSCYGRWLRAKWLKHFQKLEQEKEGGQREMRGRGHRGHRWKSVEVVPANSCCVSRAPDWTHAPIGRNSASRTPDREREKERETRGERAQRMQGMR